MLSLIAFAALLASASGSDWKPALTLGSTDRSSPQAIALGPDQGLAVVKTDLEADEARTAKTLKTLEIRLLDGGGVMASRYADALPNEGSSDLVGSSLEVLERVTFRVWGSHGDFEPSIDGRFVYFGENGPDGLVIKRATLSNGVVEVVAKTGKETYRLAAIPGDPRHLVAAWQAGLGAASPYEVAALDLETGQQQLLDVGSSWGDGVLRVSPSGRWLATGAQVVSPVGRAWYPSEIAVFSLATGKREFTYKIPMHDERVMIRDTIDSSHEVVGRIPDTVNPNWTTDDTLILSDRQRSADTAFQRGSGGVWAKTEVLGITMVQTSSVQKNLYPGEQLRFRRAQGGEEVALPPQAIFGQRGRLFFGYNLQDFAIALRQDRGSDGWDNVEVVVLKWKAGSQQRAAPIPNH